MANDQGSIIPSAFPRDPDNPTPTQIRPLILIATDGTILRSAEELTSHILKPDHLSDSAFERLQDALSNQDPADPIKPNQAAPQNKGAANKRPSSFHEPWTIGEFGDVVTCSGDIVVDPSWSTLRYLGPLASGQYMRRIVACVNFCRAVATEELERSPAPGVAARKGGAL